MFHTVLRTLGHAYPKMSVFVYEVRLAPGPKQALPIQNNLECCKVVQRVLELAQFAQTVNLDIFEG